MSTLTFEPDFYKFQKKHSHGLETFDDKLRNVYNDKVEKRLCQFWGCHESLNESNDEPTLCCFHEKMITNIFQTNLTAFIVNEPDMFAKIKLFISNENNICLIQHLNDLFDKSNEIYIGQHKKYGVRTVHGCIFMVDDAVGLFMSYIKNMKPWLLSDKHLTEWLSENSTEDIVDELTSMSSFTVPINCTDDVTIHYIKSLTKDNMIELICHHIANDIRNVYTKQYIRVE